MAAAEYYNPGAGNMSQAPHQPPRPQHSQQHLNPLPYPISDAPPPYSAFAEGRAQSQPPPCQRPPLHPNFTPQSSAYPSPYGRPPNQNMNTHQYPEKQVHFQPQPQSGSPFPQPSSYRPQSQQGYPFPAGQPPLDPNRRSSLMSRPAASSQSPYRYDSDYDSRSERSRSRSRDRGSRRRHHHHHHKQPQQKKKGNGVSTFLGAGGGAVIGDIIFPGLGTIGGALLGGVGGHEYGKQKRSYSNDRDYYEENVRRGRRR